MDIAELGMLLETIDADTVSPEEFSIAADRIRQLKLDDDQKLQLYGLYKQATVGDIDAPKPWAIQIADSAKWNAWKQFEGFPQTTAAAAYVYIVTQLCDGTVPQISGDGSQYSAYDGLGVTVSTLLNSVSGEQQDGWSESEKIFQATIDNDIEKLKSCLSTSDINMRNEEGLSPLHFAADRGFLDILKCLIEAGADIHSTDGDGQSALDYARMCEHEDIITYLESRLIENAGS